MFTTLKATASDATTATTDLRKLKDETIEKLVSIGTDPAKIMFAPSRLREWDDSGKATNVFGFGINDRSETLTVTNLDPEMYTAHAAVQVEWSIEKQELDEIILIPISLVRQIRENAIFKPVTEDAESKIVTIETYSELQLIFVGEITEAIDQAKLKAGVDEATAHAKQIGTLPGIELGKLEMIKPEVDGRWRYDYAIGYQNSRREDSVFPNPMSLFKHLPTEVYGSDPAELHRDYSVTLRYALK